MERQRQVLSVAVTSVREGIAMDWLSGALIIVGFFVLAGCAIGDYAGGGILAASPGDQAIVETQIWQEPIQTWNKV